MHLTNKNNRKSLQRARKKVRDALRREKERRDREVEKWRERVRTLDAPKYVECNPVF
jgi:FtsZ-binding cell division protein ZapB